MSMLFLCFLALTAAAPERDDRRAPLLGVWTGSSLCTDVRPACHDEQALYRILPSDDRDAPVRMSMAKVVNGKEVVMGTLPFSVDFVHQTLSSEYKQGPNHILWSFAWTGKELTGTLKLLPNGEVVRNIKLHKQ
jgi:hypothetical protein